MSKRIELNLEFIFPYLKSLSKRSYEIKLIEFYSYNVKGRNTIREFKEWLLNEIYPEANHLLETGIDLNTWNTVVTKIMTKTDEKIFEYCDLDFYSAEFLKFSKITKDEIKAIFIIKEK